MTNNGSNVLYKALYMRHNASQSRPSWTFYAKNHLHMFAHLIISPLIIKNKRPGDPVHAATSHSRLAPSLRVDLAFSLL